MERTLGYLGREHHERRVIATDEYAMMVMEVKEILSSGCLPATIVPLKLQPNGALLSGFSVGFVTYGIICSIAGIRWCGVCGLSIFA